MPKKHRTQTSRQAKSKEKREKKTEYFLIDSLYPHSVMFSFPPRWIFCQPTNNNKTRIAGECFVLQLIYAWSTVQSKKWTKTDKTELEHILHPSIRCKTFRIRWMAEKAHPKMKNRKNIEETNGKDENDLLSTFSASSCHKLAEDFFFLFVFVRFRFKINHVNGQTKHLVLNRAPIIPNRK